MGKTQYTKITPLPSNIPRQLALDLLHSHEEYINLNPLVTGVKAIDAPRDATPDEYFSSWYEITEVITWGFGMKKKVSFKGVFHDQPWGLQTHTYAPMGVDLRINYRVGGNQPGEPREARELGVNTPQDGLYIREDCEIASPVPLTANFVKKETQQAVGAMIERMKRKAELLDDGQIMAMFENGRLKTAKQTAAHTFGDKDVPSPTFPGESPGSTGMSSPSMHNPRLSRVETQMTVPVDSKGFGRYNDMARANSTANRNSGYAAPHRPHSGYDSHNFIAELDNVAEGGVSEMPGSMHQVDPQQQSLYPAPLKQATQSFVSELPGDMTYRNSTNPPQGQNYQTPPPSHLAPQYNASPASQGSDTKPQYQPYTGNGIHPSQRQYPSSPPPNQQGFQPYSQPQYPTQDQSSRAHSPPYHPQQRNSSTSVESWQHGLAINHGPHQAGDPHARGSSSQFPVSHPQPQHRQPQRYSPQQPQQQAPPPQRDGPRHPSQPQDQYLSRQVHPQSPPAAVGPDRQRFSTLSIQDEPPDGRLTKGFGKCPVCNLFEGDEAAINYHLGQAHGFK